jgi:hypothetical protein
MGTITTTSFSNTPQATNDVYTATVTGLTEDSLGIVKLSVMANDLGGNAKSLYSVDDGYIGAYTNDGSSNDTSGYTDLLSADGVGALNKSKFGATIAITSDGQIEYNASTLDASFIAQLQALSSGQFLEDTFTYAIRLGNGTLSSATVTVQIAGVNDAVGPVTDVNGAAGGGVSENAVNGTAVGITASAVDIDSGSTITYTLSNDAGGRFAIDGTTGVVTVADGSLLDAEDATSHDITVLATSTDGSTASETFTIAVTNENDNAVVGPTDDDGAPNTVAENAADGTVVGITALASDADLGASVSYTLSDDANGRFAIDGTTGVVTVADGSLLDAEDATSHDITVLATSTDGSTNSNTFSIAVTDIDDTAPSVSSIVNQTPSSATTNADSLTFRVSFSEAVVNVDAADFTVSGTTATITSVSAVNSSTYDVTISGGDLASLNGTVTMGFSGGQNIADTASNALTNTAPTGTNNNSYVVDNQSPTVTSVSYGTHDGTLKAGESVNLIVNFSEAVTVTGGTPSLTLNSGGTASYTSGSGTSALTFSYTVASGQTASDLTVTAVNLLGATVHDTATNNANTAGAATNPSGILMVDTTGPNISSALTNAYNPGVNVFSAGTISDTGSGVVSVTVHDTNASPVPDFSLQLTGGTATGGAWSTDGDTNATLGTSDNIEGHSVTVTATDAAGNVSTKTGTAPAGISGEAINLALPSTNSMSSTTVVVSGLADGWSLNTGTNNGDGTWTVQSQDVTSLAVRTPADYSGAVVLDVSLNWVNPDGTTGQAFVSANVEAFAPGWSIFAISGDDNLTGSSSADTFVFAAPTGVSKIYSFDVAVDTIDLIGFVGIESFADLQGHFANNAAGNALVTLGEGKSIELLGVDAGTVTEANFVFNVEPTNTNTGTITISNGAFLPLGGTIVNEGVIELDSTGAATNLQILVEGVTLTGGGEVVLSDDTGNVIFGGTEFAKLVNVDNTISGAGQLGAGQLTLRNEGIIRATGNNPLVINTGTNTVMNYGTLVAVAAGGMIIDSVVENWGNFWADGGNIAVAADVTGTGGAMVSGTATLEFDGSSTVDVMFAAGGSGTLKLAQAGSFTGTIYGLGDGDSVQVGDLIFSPTTSVSFTSNQDGTGGVLTISDGSYSANLKLAGQYAADGFAAAADSAGGLSISYLPGTQMLVGTEANDVLVGGSGNEILMGGAGDDTLTGGLGNDVFKFSGVNDGMDTISDFTIGNLDPTKGALDSNADVLDLHDVLQGVEELAGVVAADDAATVSQYISFTVSGTIATLQVDADGNGAAAAAPLATISVSADSTAASVLNTLLHNNQIVV